MKKRTLLLILTVILMLSVVACGSKSDNAMGVSRSPYAEAEYYGYDMMPEEAVPQMAMSDSYKASVFLSEVNSQITDTRKIIKNVSLSLETLEFDKAVESIKADAVAQGGYIESSYISGSSINDGYGYNQRYASFTIRVPANILSNYVDSLSKNYNMLSINESSSDITDQYYDTESRLNSLVTQEERLLSMLEGATELQYMLEIERNLADVRYQIENYYSTLTRYDNQVSMSTVSINLQEVVKYQEIIEPPKTFGERFSSAIAGSWNNFVYDFQNFVIDFTYALPGLLTFLVILAVIIVIIVVTIKRNRKKKRNENADI